MRRLTITCLLALSAVAALAVAPGVAMAKKHSGPKPVISRVAPMRISVGHLLTIRGSHFRSSRKGNTIIFRSNAGRTAFAKPMRASRTKLVVRVPAAVARLLSVKNSKQRPTRLKLRVLAGKFSAYTSRRLSPVVTGVGEGDGGGGTTTGACDTGTDFDGDLLPNSLELAIGTDPCLRDTDKDGVEDGFEYESALDLNHYPANPPLPYPGKRPYPNALDPSDANTDYDGDSLTQREEFAAWMDFSSDGVARSGNPTSLANLTYSDGLQQSKVVAAPAPGTLANWVLDFNGDGVLADDERDADGDGISNYDEQHGRFTEVWWPAEHDGTNEPKESKYPGINFLDVEDLSTGLALVVPDMDGDGVLDGNDDQDHDGLSNRFELRRPATWQNDAIVAHTDDWAYTNPFNPCKPFNSSRCHAHPPFGYYASDQVPPIGPNPPAGFPGSAPTIP
jgi:IPT/TIG domain-containing protein